MLKLLALATEDRELAPLLPGLRRLYYERRLEGRWLTHRNEDLPDNPLVQRSFQEFSTTAPSDPPSPEWLRAAARRAVLEERPDLVVLPSRESFYPDVQRLCEELGVACRVGQVEPPATPVMAPPRRPWTGPGPPGFGELARAPDPAAALREALAGGGRRFVEAVNLPLPEAPHTFAYGLYDNEFALGPASHDLLALCREALPERCWRARLLAVPSGSAHGPQEHLEAPAGPVWLELEVLKTPAEPGFWLDRFALSSRQLKVVFADPKNVAGSVVNHALTVNRYTEHEAIALTRERHPFIGYPETEAGLRVLTEDPSPELVQFLEEADGFVFFDDEDETSPAWPVDLRPYVEGKRVVHLYVGWKVHGEVARLQRPGRTVLTPLPHVLKMVPQAAFYAGFPPVVLDELELRPPRSARDGVLRVLHTVGLPDRGASRFLYHKDSESFLAAARELRPRFPGCEFWQLSGVDFGRVLQARQECDVTFNHLRGYISLGGGEALYLERPLVHAFDASSRNRHLEYWGLELEFPWVDTTPGELAGVLAGLLEDAALRERLGREGRQFMLEYFSPRRGIVPLLHYLENAPPAVVS